MRGKKKKITVRHTGVAQKRSVLARIRPRGQMLCKVEVAVQGSPSRIVLMVSVDVKHHEGRSINQCRGRTSGGIFVPCIYSHAR